MPKARAAVRFTHERTYSVRYPVFTLFKSVTYLDPVRLGRGTHVIELGKFEGCHCDCAVTATVKAGMIKRIHYPKCETATKIPPRLAKKIATAGRRLTKQGRAKWQDIPIRELTTSAAARRRIVVVVTTSGDCYEVCIDPGTGLQTCWICCPGWCIGPSDPHVAFI